jgi:hypothetical protein
VYEESGTGNMLETIRSSSNEIRVAKQRKVVSPCHVVREDKMRGNKELYGKEKADLENLDMNVV